jgi:adenine-specific DNA-methyltransferase
LGLRNSDVALKKLILINNLHGVDINPNGIEIAKLRLWLWLVDSYEPERVEPLPNIDYNLRVGNSLIGYVDLGEFKGAKLTLSDFLRDEEKPTLDDLLKERNDLIHEYKITWGEEAKELKGTVQEFDVKISNLLNSDLYRKFREKKIQINREGFLKLNPFHWGFEFYDIFDLDKPKAERGFDVVIGNPPYIRNRELKETEKRVMNNTFKTAEGQYDIYQLFFEEGTNLMKYGALLGFITSNKYTIANYGKKLRKLILDNYQILSLIDISNIMVFKDASTYPYITILRKETDENIRDSTNIKIMNVDSAENLLKSKQLEIKQSVFLDSADFEFNIHLDKDKLPLLKEIQRDAIPLGDIALIKETVHTGNIREKLIVESRVNEKCKKLLRGRDCQRYYFKWQNLWIVANTDIINKSKGEYANIPDDFYFRPPKLFLREIANEITSCYDEEGYYSLNKAYVINQKDKGYPLKFILALLNSELLSWFFRIKYESAHVRGGYLQFKKQYTSQLPIKRTLKYQQQPFIKLVDKIIFLNETEERRESEEELIEFIDQQIIDSLVYELYFKEKFEEEGLKTNLLGLVEPYLKNIEGLEGTDEEKLRVVKEVVEGIRGDSRIMKEIEKIKSHEWVKVIEG